MVYEINTFVTTQLPHNHYGLHLFISITYLAIIRLLYDVSVIITLDPLYFKLQLQIFTDLHKDLKNILFIIFTHTHVEILSHIGQMVRENPSLESN